MVKEKPEGAEIHILNSQIAVLEQLIEVYKNSIVEQADQLGVEIAERRRIELSLTESEGRLRSLLQTIPDLVWQKDVNGVFLACNTMFERFFGAKETDIIGKTDYDFVDKELADFFRENDRKAMAAGRPSSNEEWVTFAEGHRVLLDTIKTPMFDAEGKIIGVLGIARDITERKRTEETLEKSIRRLNEELERKVMERTRQLFDAQEELVRKEKLAILGQISGSVGHELRNPLGVMSNAIYFLKMVLADADDTTKEYLEIIKHEIDNSLRIITDLLDFARTKAPQIQAVTARTLLDKTLGRCAFPENVALQTDIPDSLPLLRVDPLQMGQVLTNLIINAVQAMPEGGALCVTARLEEAIQEPFLQSPKQENEDFIKISVTDTGVGISAENMIKLFQPLFTTKPKGIGLGLVVCKNLVEANGGRVEVESDPGEGTTFTVALPVERREGEG